MADQKFSDLTVSQIITFLDVAETLNMSQSAEKLFVGQPTISKRINDIEAILKLKLFHRTKNNLTLTQAGKQFYYDVKRVYEHLEQSVYNAQAIQRSYQGNFNLCIDTIFDMDVLYKLITDFKGLYPRIKIKMETDVYDVKHRIINCEIDLAMVDSDLNDPDKRLSYYKILEYPLCIVVSKEHHLAGREHLSLSDLMGEQFVIPSDYFSEDYMPIFQEFFKNARIAPNVIKSVRSFHLEFQVLFNKNVMAMTAPSCIQENRKETLEFLKKHIKVFYIDELTVPLYFCWKTNNYIPQIESFLNLYKKIAKQPEIIQKLEQFAHRDIFD